MPIMAILRVKSGPQKGKMQKIEKDSLVIGRDATADIQILDHGVSRRHAEIFRIGEIYFIQDLKSRNGTYLNEQKIEEEPLRIGDQIRVGNSVVVFEDRQVQLRDSSRLLSPEEGPVPSPSSTIHLRTTHTPLEDDGPVSTENRNLQVLLHLSHIIGEEKNLSRLVNRVCDLMGRSMKADHVYVLGVGKSGPKNGNFDILGRFDREPEDHADAGVSRGIIRDCLTQSRSVLTSDASLDQQFNTMASVVMKQLRSIICVPITVLGKSSGVIYIHSKHADAFSSEDLELASAVGIQLGSTFELLKLLRRSDRFFRDSIKTLVAAIEMATPDRRGTAERVATYCLAVAKELGFNTQDTRDAWLAGMLHDIGSIPMTEKERENPLTSETKRNHNARELLRNIPSLTRILPALQQQNERWDGSGSPESRQGETIEPLARVLGIALELDKLLNRGKPDGAELSVKETLLKIKETADKQFDRQTVNALLIAYRNGKLFNQEEEFFEVPAVS